MKLAMYLLLSGFFVALTAVFTPAVPGQETGTLYGKAVLTPMFGLANKGESGPRGTALFYRVGDAANSTRVVVEIEGLTSAEGIMPGITAGDCQGNGVASLNPLISDQPGKGHSTTILTGQQVSFGQWYVHAYFCDMLNPGQVCSVCGRVEPVTDQTTQHGTGAKATGNLPVTGASSATLQQILLLVVLGIALLVGGTHLRRSQRYYQQHD